MSDHEEKQNKKDDLLDVKSLIKGADTGNFSLDDILTEYSRTPGGSTGKVVAFPGKPRPPQPEEDEEGEEDDAQEESCISDQDQMDDAPSDTSPKDRMHGSVIPFPEEESILSAFLKDLGQKADDYADQMFEEDETTDPEEVRCLEELIPGTDQEEVDEEPKVSFHWRRPKRVEPPPPDTPPQKLAQRYTKGISGLWVRSWFVFLLSVLALFQALVPALGFVWTPPLDALSIQGWINVGLLGAGMLLSCDMILISIIRSFHGKLGMDTLSTLACIFTLADGITYSLSQQPEPRLPFGLVCLFGLFCQLFGNYHKWLAIATSCRTASASSHPYRVTLDEEKWNSRDTYTKWMGTPEDFGSQIQSDDGAQRIFRVVCPLLLISNILFSALSSFGTNHPQRIFWTLSALFTVSSAFGGTIAYGRSFHKISRRLAQNGASLAGWPGIARTKKGSRVLLTDIDLFPAGHIELNGYKVMKDFPAERVMAYTATLIRDSGSGLGRLFHDQLRSMGGLLRKADSLVSYEGGGLSANIRGDQVLVGSASFMNLMEIPLPQGLNIKNAVFCSINHELAGIFALNYTLHDTVPPAIEELLAERVGPVLATRDFNLIPSVLQQRFKLPANRMDFPSVERRQELSSPDQEHSATLTALLCREGLLPFAESVVAARRLCRATRMGCAICCIGSTLGILLATYLTSIGAYTSLSVLNLMIYMLTWLTPVWLLSGWAHRF